MSWRPSTVRVLLGVAALLTALLMTGLSNSGLSGSGLSDLSRLADPSATRSDPSGPRIPSRVVDHGPASMVTATRAAEQVGDRLYTTTNGVSPVVVGAYDPSTERVEQTYELPTGKGAWGMAHLGTDLYVGVYGPGDLYRIDTETGEVDRVARFGQWIWDLTVSPDGTLFAGTYPDAEVYEYDPATGQSRNLGVAAPGESYVRSIVADEDTVYAGIGAHAGLVAIDRETGARRDVIPERYRDRTFVGSLDLRGDQLVAGLSPTATVLVFDTDRLDAPRELRPPGDDNYVPALAIDRSGGASDGDVVFGTRPSGTLYRYVSGTEELARLGRPYPGATTYALFPGAETIRAQLAGEVMEYDIGSGEFDVTELAGAGLPPRPELPMAIAATADKVFVSGKSGIELHDVSAENTIGDSSGDSTGGQSSRRVRLVGEAKTMTPVSSDSSDRVYLGVYTLARLFSVRPDGSGLSELAERIGAEQTRPTDSAYDPATDRLLVSTEPDYGRMNGALALLDPDSDELDVYRGVLPGQTVYSVAVDGRIGLLGGSIRNGLGTDPVDSEAKLAMFDLRDRTVSWWVRPVPDARAVSDLVVHEGRVFGTTDTGRLFEFDPRTRSVDAVVEVGEGMGALVEAGGELYGADGDHVYHVDVSDPGAPVATTVVDGLAAEWYGGRPLLAASPNGESLYTLRKRDLIQIAVG